MRTIRFYKDLLKKTVHSCKILFARVDDLEPIWNIFDGEYDYAGNKKEVIELCEKMIDQFKPINQMLEDLLWSIPVNNLPNYHFDTNSYTKIKQFESLVSKVKNVFWDAPKLCREVIIHLKEPRFTNSAKSEEEKAKDIGFAKTWLQRLKKDMENDGIVLINQLKAFIENLEYALKNSPLSLRENKEQIRNIRMWNNYYRTARPLYHKLFELGESLDSNVDILRYPYNIDREDSRIKIINDCEKIINLIEPIKDLVVQIDSLTPFDVRDGKEIMFINKKLFPVQQNLIDEKLGSCKESTVSIYLECVDISLNLNEPLFSKMSEYTRQRIQERIVDFRSMPQRINQIKTRIKSLKEYIIKTSELKTNLRENQDPEETKRKIKRDRLIQNIKYRLKDLLENLYNMNQITPWKQLEKKMPKWQEMIRVSKKNKLKIQKILQDIIQGMTPFYDYLGELSSIFDYINQTDPMFLAGKIPNENMNYNVFRYQIQYEYSKIHAGLVSLKTYAVLSDDKTFYQNTTISEIEEAFRLFEYAQQSLNRFIKGSIELYENQDPEETKRKIKRDRLKNEVDKRFGDFIKNLDVNNQKTPWKRLELEIPDWRKMKNEKHRLAVQQLLKEIDEEMFPFYDYLAKTVIALNDMDFKTLLLRAGNSSINFNTLKQKILNIYEEHSIGITMMRNALEKVTLYDNNLQYDQEVVERIEEAFHYLEDAHETLNIFTGNMKND